MLEIGCCYGYNLAYLGRECNFKCYGIEPSKKAISYGKQVFEDKIEIIQGTADDIDYNDDFF